jgi:hypothetical protein
VFNFKANFTFLERFLKNAPYLKGNEYLAAT